MCWDKHIKILFIFCNRIFLTNSNIQKSCTFLPIEKSSARCSSNQHTRILTKQLHSIFGLKIRNTSRVLENNMVSQAMCAFAKKGIIRHKLPRWTPVARVIQYKRVKVPGWSPYTNGWNTGWSSHNMYHIFIVWICLTMSIYK